MKKIFLTFLCILIAMQGIAAANSIYIDDVEAKPGDIVTLSIKMTNTEADKYCGFQFDVVLPEGISFVKDDGFYEVALSTERTTANKTNFFDSALQGDGSLRILCNTSVNNSNVGHLYCFSGTSGEICTIKVKIDETLVTGEYSVKLQNVSMSDYTAKSISVENSTSKIKVKVDVPDVMKLYAGNVQARPGEKVTLSVQMDNDTPNSLCGFQFDVCLPEGVTFAKNGDIYNAALSTARTTVSKTNFFDSVIQSDGSLRILCNTTAKDNETGNLYCFSGKSGEVCTVEIELGHNVSIGKHYILLKNIAISDYSSVSHIVGDYTLELEVQPIEVSSVSLNKSSLTITEGDVEKLTATVIPANATDQSITWTTSDANVAKVDTEGNVTAVAEGTAIITATSGNGKTAQCAVIVSRKPNPVTAIALNKTTLKITEGDSETLTVTYTPADADDRNVTWTSSDDNVATVDVNGKVTAVAEGTAIITATSENGKTAQCAVIVSRKPNPVTSIALNKASLQITEGDSETLTVTYTPADADDRNVTWTSSDNSIATVDVNGKVTAVAEGAAIITAISGNGKTAQCAVVVSRKPNPVTAIALNKTSLQITEGDSETLTVTYTPADADARSVTWSSSDNNIATVDANGNVTAVAEGAAIITATSGNGKTAQCAVVVSRKANPVTAIALNKTSLKISEGDSETLTVTYTPADADDRNVTWSSSDNNIATVDAEGMVTAVAEGVIIITATSINGKIAQCVVIVEKDTESISFADSNVKTICIENWDFNGDGKLSKTEAAAVSSLGEVFRDNKVITSFNELQYFTGLTEICDNAFSECAELTSVVIPDNVTRIGEGAFWCARKLSSVNIPKNVKRIEFGAFRDCYSLNSIELPNGIESIDIWAFYGPRLNSITIPSSLVYLGNNRGYDRTFADCSCYMNSMVVEEGNPVFDSRNNCNAIIETNTNTLLFGCSNTVIPNDITSIGQYAFFDCKDMESIDLPDNLVSISGSAFSGCSGLRTVKIPDRVIAIGHEGFNNCHSLTSVTIPKGVTTIDKAFNNCENLTTVIEMREEPPVITGPDAFTNYANATLYVPYGCKAKYEVADYWKDFKEIVEMDAQPAMLGDVNGDDEVTMADANMVVNYFLAVNKPDDFNIEAADVNGDGDITMADANMIVNMFLNGTTTEVTNKHEAVNLGLSVKWATCNVGANSPEEFGDYFAWGETEPKDDYDWPTYKWCNGSYNTQTKYNANSYYGTVDNRTTLEPVDDAATVNWGGSWRMPTYKEQTALRDSCYWEWTTNYNDKGVSGYIVYKAKAAADRGLKKHIGSSTTASATYSLSDNHIFLPAAGYRGNWDAYYTEQNGGYYWSDMVNPDYDAYNLFICPGDVRWRNYDRSCGQSIRPVCP